MLLAIDIGNSDIVLGVYHHDTWTQQWRIKTSKDKSSAAYEMDMRNRFLENNLKINDIENIVLSSVVPPITQPFKNALVNFFGKEPILLGPAVYAKLDLYIERPHEIGSDLVANAMAAYTQFKQNCIVVDFGTALTFTVVSGKGRIIGVSIAPGLKTAMYSLFLNTAQLPEVPLELPKSAIGTNTTHALQAGVLWGYVGLVEFMVKKIQEELQEDFRLIATGGLSSILSPLKNIFSEIDQMLTLNGLRIIEEIYRKKSAE